MSRWQSVLQGRLVEDMEEALYALKVFALPACNCKEPSCQGNRLYTVSKSPLLRSKLPHHKDARKWGGTLLTACNCRVLKACSHQKKRTATEGWRQTLLKVRACKPAVAWIMATAALFSVSY